MPLGYLALGQLWVSISSPAQFSLVDHIFLICQFCIHGDTTIIKGGIRCNEKGTVLSVPVTAPWCLECFVVFQADFDIYFLSDGTVRRKQSDEENVYQEGAVDIVQTEESKELSALGLEDKAALISETNEIDDLERATGESVIYQYYLRYVGWPNAVIFVLFVMMNVFSGTYSQIWLEQWTSHGGSQKSLYVTVYFFLGICNVVGNGGHVW
ncbi:P-loop containing nucleoside triphosphate hydrolase protein [Penicillium malachiteum]|uniref:P-loop containing nucleoside triphosphate hydrolase protein n=1 Tax=Penicillium malachiteum TaxID=1324776 RepID=UPI002548969C|nr:P-loop containing nucleoside triphosphate hydrolase protein [Penicillium malachiteum]KAJ5736646.1 P-loop containing nucleoside triphosphate hydrolase protein [Penicillium malachiteum]